MNDAVVELLHEFELSHMVAAVAALVAEAPEDDRGEVAVAQYHAARAVEVGSFPTVVS